MSEATRAPTLPDAGPLLTRLLDAQSRDVFASGQVALRRSAKALAAYARENGGPWIEPVSPAGHRLAGAAAALDGTVRLRPPGQTANGQNVLLVEGVAVGPAAVADHAQRMRAAGAVRVWAFAVDLPSDSIDISALDGVLVIHP